jgi:hypothetical protein
MYSATIMAIAIRKEKGGGLNPNSSRRGVKGNMTVAATITRVVPNKYFPGVLLKKGRLLRITNTIRDAEITDSTNQPVLKSSVELCRTKRSTPKVR